MFYLLVFFAFMFSLAADDLALAVTENDPSTLVEGVSVITGDLYIFEEDYVVQGAKPISLHRSFLSREGFFRGYKHLTGSFLCAANRIAVNEPNGTTIHYFPDPKNGIFPEIGENFFGEKKSKQKILRYNALSENNKGISNTKTGEISARTNLKNQYILFDPSADNKGKSFTLYTPDGTKRRYIHFNAQEKVKTPYGEQYLLYSYKLESETFPDGHIVHYKWDNKNRIERIYTTNISQKKIFSSLTIPVISDLKNPPEEITLTGSDQRFITYKSHSTDVKKLYVTDTVIAPDLSDQYFDWDLKPRWIARENTKRPYLQRLSLPKKRSLHISYSDEEDPIIRQQKIDQRLIQIRENINKFKPKAKKKPAKYKQELEHWKAEEKRISKDGIENEGVLKGYQVKSLSSPVGIDSTLIITHSFFYDFPSKSSYVLDVKNNKTTYFWNDDYRLIQVNRFTGTDKLHSSDTFLWEKANLRCKTFLNHKSAPVFARTYLYDDRGNVREETFYGNLSGSGQTLKIGADGLPEDNGVEQFTKKSKYSEDGRNLLLKHEVPSSNLSIVYTYRDDWQLLKAKSICEGEKVQIHHKYEYDEDLLLASETIDDDISRITKKIRPYKNGPYIGMPETVEEYHGKDQLLRKTVLYYSKGAAVEKKDIYDANTKLRYSLKMTYDDKGRLKSETNALGQEATYNYDEVGNRIYAKSFSGRLETFCKYDFSNRLIKKEEKGDDGVYRKYEYTYDTKHNLITETDSYDNEIIYVPDAFGHQKEIHFPPVSNEKSELVYSITEYDFDSAGNEIEKTDRDGNITLTDYNAYGKPILITHPDKATEEFSYYLDGNLKSYTDPKNVVTFYEYDYLGQVIKKTTAHAEEIFEYTGQYLIKKTDAEKNSTIYQYDLAGRKISEECCGEETTYTYDELGRLHTTQKKDLVTVTEYDLLNRVTEERNETVTQKVLRKVRYEYDSAGNRNAIIRFVDDKEAREELKYDSVNRLIERKDPLGFIETYDYDSKFNRKTHTDPLGLQTIETYNPQNQLSSIEKKKGDKTLSFEEKFYNKNGQLSLQINTVYRPDGTQGKIQTRWDYNSRGLLKTLTEADGTINAKITHYTYTPRGELETVLKPDKVVLTYQYNELGHLESLTSSDDSVNHRMRYNLLGHLQQSNNLLRETDPFGRTLLETFPHGHSIQNAYDSRGRRENSTILQANCSIIYEYDTVNLKQITRKKLDGTSLYSHTYLDHDLSGNILKEERIDSGYTFYAIDPLSRKFGIKSFPFEQEVLKFDSVGNILKMRKAAISDVVYTYDDLYQLTSETGLFSHSYSYDSLNNRLEKDQETYAVNSLNQIDSHFKYDLNGNPIRLNETTYKYDALDRLIQIKTPDFSQTFTYDSLHRCLSKTTTQGQNEKTIYFLYDGQNEMGAFDEQLNPLELRILGNTPHAEIGATVGIELNGIIHVPIHDLQGNLAVLQPLGSTPTFYHYSAFGEEKIFGEALSPWRFSSKRTDSDLVYFGRRFYIPTLGRWLTPDPLGFTDGMNLYAYVHNDPLTHFDEYGLFDAPPWDYASYNYYSWSRSKWNKPAPIRFKSGLNSFNSPVRYVNGILNTHTESISGACTLANTFAGKANTIAFHSESWGALKDLASVKKSRKDPGYTSFAIRRLNRELRWDINCLDSMNDPRKLFINCFSRGTTDTYHACKTLTRDQRDRLIITACGPIMTLPRNLGFSVMNLISEGDWCSLHYHKGFKKNPRKFESFADVRLLPQQDGFSGFNRDHFFKSKTYQEGTSKFTVPLYDEYGVLK